MDVNIFDCSQEISSIASPKLLFPLILTVAQWSLRKKKSWIICNFFSINLTLILPATYFSPWMDPFPITSPEVNFKTFFIQQTLQIINIEKSSGTNGIPAIVLKNIAPEPLLTLLFHISQNNRIFPRVWGKAQK